MSDLDEKIQALDLLLEQVAETPAVKAIRERAEDSGHLDDDWIMALTTGTASEEEQKNARRHVVFCDQCAALLLNRGGEADEGDLTFGAPSATKSPQQSTKKKTVSRNDAKRLGVALVVIAILATVVYFVLPSWLRTEFSDTTVGQQPKAIVIAGRGAGEGEEDRLSLDRLAYVRLQPQESRGREYVYVLLVDARGNVSRLEPKSGAAKRYLMSDMVELPNDFSGFDLRSVDNLAAGQRIGIFVYSHTSRIGLFEGEIFERVTKLRIKEEATAPSMRLDEAGFRSLAGKMRELGFPGRVLSTSVRLIP